MLQILRRKAQSPLIQIIVVVIALVFIFWGVGTNMGNSKQSAIVVNGEEITFQQYSQAYDRAYQQLSNQFGGNVPKGLAESLGLKQQVINQIIQTALLRQGASAMGVEVSGDDIRTFIETMPQFQDNGAFSMERYKSILAANKMAPNKFEQSLRFDQLSELATRRIGGFATIITESEIEDIYSQLNEKIEVKYARLSPADYIDKVTIDDAALASWYETAKDGYKTEPQLKVKYLTISFAEVGSKIVIDQAKIEEYYNTNLKTFRVPEQRHARHILLQAGENDSAEVHKEKAAKAATVQKLAKSGSDFISLAKQYSEDPGKNNGGDLGFFTAGQMVPAFDKAVFTMQPGAVSEVVKTQFGYHIILLEEIKPAATKTLAEATEQITATLQRKEAEALAFQVANTAYEAIIGAGSLDKYSQGQGDIKVLQTDFFTKGNAPAALKDDQQLIDKTFELNKGELSSLIKGQSGYAVVFVEDKKEPEVPELAAVRAAAEKDFRKIKSQELAETAAKEVLTAVKEGKSFDDAAKEKGLVIKDSGPLGQNAPEGKSDFPAALLQTAFLLSKSSPLPETPGRAGDNFYVYTFVSRDIPKLPDNAQEIDRYKSSLQRYKQQQLLAAWLRHLEVDAKITTHKNL
ncbi:MAG: SurA N-terminal domain-containing protein [Desulforhopalus sp.]|nr:SurA N-terminal domain-containing protein [Desulforhopalus sp.]